MSRWVGILLIASGGAFGFPAIAAAQDPPPTLPDAPKLQAAVVQPPATPPPARGPVLPLLYGSFITLEAYDGYSTTRGIREGRVEQNTLMIRLAEHPAALWSVKAGAAVLSIYVSERLWRHHHRGEAIVVMLASNAIVAAVAANNASVMGAPR